MVLHSGTNALSLQGYNRLGAPIPSAIGALTAVFTGAEPDATGALVISEALPDRPPGEPAVHRVGEPFGVRLRPRGWRLDGVGVTFPLGSIVTNGQTFVLARDRATFLGNYPGVPVFGTFNTTLGATQTILSLVKIRAPTASRSSTPCASSQPRRGSLPPPGNRAN